MCVRYLSGYYVPVKGGAGDWHESQLLLMTGAEKKRDEKHAVCSHPVLQ